MTSAGSSARREQRTHSQPPLSTGAEREFASTPGASSSSGAQAEKRAGSQVPNSAGEPRELGSTPGASSSSGAPAEKHANAQVPTAGGEPREHGPSRPAPADTGAQRERSDPCRRFRVNRVLLPDEVETLRSDEFLLGGARVQRKLPQNMEKSTQVVHADRGGRLNEVETRCRQYVDRRVPGPLMCSLIPNLWCPCYNTSICSSEIVPTTGGSNASPYL